MFLTRGYVQHHDTWKLWFEDVQGMLPLSAMQVLCLYTPFSIALCEHLCTQSLGVCAGSDWSECGQAAGCTAETISTAGHSCGMSGGPKLLHQQHLFSVVTHVGAAEDFSGEGLDALMAKPYAWMCMRRLRRSQRTHSSLYLESTL